MKKVYLRDSFTNEVITVEVYDENILRMPISEVWVTLCVNMGDFTSEIIDRLTTIVAQHFERRGKIQIWLRNKIDTTIVASAVIKMYEQTTFAEIEEQDIIPLTHHLECCEYRFSFQTCDGQDIMSPTIKRIDNKDWYEMQKLYQRLHYPNNE